MGKTNVWWIRRDIRLADNQTLAAANQNADELVPLFILEPELIERAAPKRNAFLWQALTALDQQLQSRGSRLIIRQGPAIRALQTLKEEFQDLAVFAHQDFSPFARERDEAVRQDLGLETFPGVTLRHPAEVLKSDGDPYIVYTPYKNSWYEGPLPSPADCLPVPEALLSLPNGIDSEALPSFTPVDEFPGTAQEAQDRLDDFIEEGIRHYQSRRDRLDLDGTSQLSSYLRFGLISPREAFARAQITLAKAKDSQTRQEIRTWMNELVWREFYNAILYHFPHVLRGPFREDYADIPWRYAPEDLGAWQAGQTGFPVVDACMRQLLETGWMHNRGRMITASFLTKDLLINWQEGEAWFMANLVDGDPAANNGGWQWTAGTGTDAAPYFRIFNPVLQGQKYDPDGAYIARWVPELRCLPKKFRHEPWKMSEEEQNKYGVHLGKDYPKQIVNHKFARQRTLEAYKRAREQSEEENA